MELEDRTCPICASVETSVLYMNENVKTTKLTESAFSSRKLPEYMHFQLMRCTECDLVYASPAIRGDLLGDAYRDAAFDASRESAFAAQTYFEYLQKYAVKRPCVALDIGAGDGAFLCELMRNGFDDVFGFEPSAAPVKAAPAEVQPRLRNTMFDGTGIAEGSVGLVTCFQTIEHVFDPLKLLRDIHRVLATGGVAFLVGHNVKAFSAKILGEKSPIYDIEHYQLFSESSARKIMRAAGFNSILVFPIMNAYPLAYWVKLLPIPIPMKELLLSLLNGRLRQVGEINIRVPAGNLAVIATK